MIQARSRIVPCGLFVLSGMAGLVLEAVLLRQLALLFGNTASATALVLSAFMGGLALGAVWFGKVADRSRNPLALFGLLELGTAASGASLAWLLGYGREIFLAPIRAVGSATAQSVVEFALAFLLVLVPTVLMGGTLPALSRLLIRRMSGFVGSIGLLYGLNTFGAAIGVFLAGFYLFELAGVAGSAYLAASVQAAVGVAAILVGRLRADVPTTEDTVAESVPSEARSSEGEPTTTRTRAAYLIAAGVGGFAVLGYEVVWTRLLSLMLRSFSYSFSLMLSLFLLGLCIGAALLALAGRRFEKSAESLGWLQVAMGLYVAASILWLPAILAPVSSSSFESFLAQAGLKAALVVIPPTLLSGMVLPLAARGFARRLTDVGSDVGRVYGINTAGAIVGALLAGLLLLPGLGAPVSLIALATINATAGAVVLFLLWRSAIRKTTGGLLALSCLLALPMTGERYVDAFLGATRSAEKLGELLFFHEGASDTVAIARKNYGFHDPEAKSLITNGVAMSATVKPVWRYMALEGHLPVLLSRGAKRAMTVGVGTGITLGALASHPELESITAVELSAGVIEGLPFFEAENGRAFEDPRVRLLREDGRHYLELTEDRFDLITLEPPPPIVAGSVHLYSLDFYELCRRRLSPGGVVAQWLPLHAQSLASARMTARTFLDAFPHVTLWLPSVRDAVLVGSPDPLRLDLSDLSAAYATPATRRNLESAYLETAEAFLATYLLDRAGIERWAGDAPVITDEHPLMEFFRHQGGNMDDRDIGSLIELPQAGWDWIGGLAERPELLKRIRIENRALRLYARSAVERDNAPGVDATRLSRGTEFFRYRYGCAPAQTEALRAGAGTAPQNLRDHLARCDRLRPPSGDAARGSGRILSGVPAEIRTDETYVFYLHGAIVETQGVRPTHPQFGTYEYEAVLDRIAATGPVVISEVRGPETNGWEYARKVVSQVEALLAAGVPPGQISVVGFSKGGGIAIAVASMQENEDVRFVFLAACANWIEEVPAMTLTGRMLSIYEASDPIGRSCAELLSGSVLRPEFSELELRVGEEHGTFYRPRPEWLDPVSKWVAGEDPR